MAPFGDEVKQDAEVEIQDDVEEDIEPVKYAHGPKQPSPEEVECHRCDHQPFRSWCKWCVMGRGLGEQHRATDPSAIPKVSVDYFYITEAGVKKEHELGYDATDDGVRQREKARKDGLIIKCIVVRCETTKNVFAHCIPCKGADEEAYTAGLVVSDLAWLGHSKAIIKADNEAALQALVSQVIEILKVRIEGVTNIAKKFPTKYDSQSNGGTEVGVRCVRGLFRTLKLCLEARIGKYMPVDHAVVPWLLQHTCLLLNARVRGSDGLTSRARVRGRAFNQRMLGFGENVLYKLPTKGPKHNPDGNMGTRWLEANFMGYHRSSNTYIVATPTGIVTSRSLARRPPDNRWSAENLAKIKATPWSERERPEVEVRFQQEATADEDPAARPAPVAPRRFRINLSDLKRYGFTADCEQCKHAERYGMAKGGMMHSHACRERILEAIGSDDAAKHRITAHEERLNRSIAEKIEFEDQKAKSANAEGPQPRATAGEEPRPATASSSSSASAKSAQSSLPAHDPVRLPQLDRQEPRLRILNPPFPPRT